MNGWSWQFPKKRQSRVLVKTFSDNIFVAFPLGSHREVSDEEVIDIFLHELTGQLTELTLYAGFPVRGAVTVGPLMFSEQFLFGPALVEAVGLEKAALFPRILLSPSVLRFIDPKGKSASFVLQDSDGQAFLDYIGRRLSRGGDLKSHRKFVINGLVENRSKVRERQKYEWLARYRNYHAIEHGMDDQLIQIHSTADFTSLGGTVGKRLPSRLSPGHVPRGTERVLSLA
jgi:hypothetical protein